jgi:hypothetical protein
MAAFGGARKGYLLESFFPTMEDMAVVLDELKPKLLITNTRVPADYKSTPIEEWLQAYGRYVRHVLSGKPVTWRLSQWLHISLSDPSVRIDSSPVEGLPYKILEPSEPLIECAPQLLFFDNGRLSLSIYNLDDSAVFGLEIQHPRIARRANAKLFQAFCQLLRERSRPCVFTSGRKQLRPRLYLSTAFGPEINRHAYLRKCRLTVVDSVTEYKPPARTRARTPR